MSEGIKLCQAIGFVTDHVGIEFAPIETQMQALRDELQTIESTLYKLCFLNQICKYIDEQVSGADVTDHAITSLKTAANLLIDEINNNMHNHGAPAQEYANNGEIGLL